MMQSLFRISVAIAFLSFVGLISGERAQEAMTDVVDASIIEGKFLFEYQGFFRRPGQGNDHLNIKGLISGSSISGDDKNSL